MLTFLDAYWTALTALAPVIVVGLAIFGLACLVGRVARWADVAVERNIQAALAEDAATFGEPTRVQVEAPWTDPAAEVWWLFPAPEFHDTPIYQAMRHEADVLFAAQVLADIDDLPGGAA